MGKLSYKDYTNIVPPGATEEDIQKLIPPTSPEELAQYQDLLNKIQSNKDGELETNKLVRGMTGYPLPTQLSPIPEDLDVFKAMNPQPKPLSPLDPNAHPPVPQAATEPPPIEEAPPTPQGPAMAPSAALIAPTPQAPQGGAMSDETIRGLLENYGKRRSNLDYMNIASDFSKNMGFRGMDDYIKRQEDQAKAPVETELAARKAATETMGQQKEALDLLSSKEASDKDSAVSSVFRDVARGTLKTAGLGDMASKITDSMSASRVKELLGPLAKLAENKLAVDARMSIARENRLAREDKNKIMSDEKLSLLDKKDAIELDNHLSKGWTARSGQAGVVQGKIVSAEAAEQLIEQGRQQKNGLDSRQIEELAQSTAKLLGGSAAASARIQALVPHTWYGKAQTVKEWLTNNPQGLGQEEFVMRMAETVKREKGLAEEQKKQFQIEGLSARSGFKKRSPELYNSILRSKGIDDSSINEKGQYNKPQVDNDDTLVKMQAPDGKIKMVPKSKVAAAIRAHGKVVP